MKACLNFSLPDDSAEFNAALCGGRAVSALIDLDTFLRNAIKYQELGDEAARVLQDARDLIPQDILDL